MSISYRRACAATLVCITIMGGRVPISQSEARMPRSLKAARVGSATALEIRWRDDLAALPSAEKKARPD